ncbi:MAG TPA: hypothetical protein PKD54_10580 [Pirellulaceae bacterium]|nr:hypothetical protein [Pirellulaceae bacterium]
MQIGQERDDFDVDGVLRNGGDTLVVGDEVKVSVICRTGASKLATAWRRPQGHTT